jgi:hypothetical protein
MLAPRASLKVASEPGKRIVFVRDMSKWMSFSFDSMLYEERLSLTIIAITIPCAKREGSAAYRQMMGIEDLSKKHGQLVTNVGT